MSAMPKPVDPLSRAPEREMTEEDFQALMASDIWLYKQDLAPYHKKWVAAFGERIIDSDADEQALYDRLEALGNSVDRYKVLVRYIRGFDEVYE
jgi:hypothetical protein